jgi:hypothetical protein
MRAGEVVQASRWEIDSLGFRVEGVGFRHLGGDARLLTAIPLTFTRMCV